MHRDTITGEVWKKRNVWQFSDRRCRLFVVVMETLDTIDKGELGRVTTGRNVRPARLLNLDRTQANILCKNQASRK